MENLSISAQEMRMRCKGVLEDVSNGTIQHILQQDFWVVC